MFLYRHITSSVPTGRRRRGSSSWNHCEPPERISGTATLSPEQPQTERPPTRETAPPTSSQPPSPPHEPTPAIETPPPTPVQPPPSPPKPTSAIETPPPTPPQPPPKPTPTTEASLPLPPPPPPPPPAYPPRRETMPVQPQQSGAANTPPLHRDLMRVPPQRPSVSSKEAASAAPLTRSSTGGITMGARALYRPMPDIPEELRHRQLAVVAMARFHVAADGSATVTLLQPTADPRLNAALMSALQKWRFFPAMDSGRPIASTIDIRVPIEVR